MKELAAVQKKSSNNLFEKSLYCCSVKTLSSVFKLNPWVPCRAADLDWWLVQEQDHQGVWSDSNSRVSSDGCVLKLGNNLWHEFQLITTTLCNQNYCKWKAVSESSAHTAAFAGPASSFDLRTFWAIWLWKSSSAAWRTNHQQLALEDLS